MKTYIGKFSYIWFIMLLSAPFTLNGQISEIVDLLQTGHIDSAITAIRKIEGAQNADTRQFLRALAQSDGNQAIIEYETLLKDFPQYQYNGYARLRLGQAYFANAGYRTALEFFNGLIRNMSTTHQTGRHNQAQAQTEQAFLWAGRSYQALGMADSAASKYDWLMNNAASESLINKATNSLAYMGADTPQNQTDILQEQEVARRWTVQVGAFSNQIRAISYKDFFEDRGYSTRLGLKQRDGMSFHLVWIGSFRTRNEARRMSDELKRKWAADVTLVQTNQ
ncbi:SPOR domain-containing protein [bacterium]|nr:SPOR domain-containing protein [bacterium]